MEWNWSCLNSEQMQFYRDLCPDGEYRVIKLNSDLPGVSSGLTAKCPTVFVAASGDATGRVYYMANLLRPDPSDRNGPALDQMPFGFVFDSAMPVLSGALIQHGDWSDRTTYPPSSAWQSIVDGDYQAFSQLNIVPAFSAGKIQELDGSTQQSAFSTLINGLASMVQKKGADQATSAADSAAQSRREGENVSYEKQ